jgi:hypothetical protein
MILTCDSAGPASGGVNALFGSDININIKVKVKGSGRGRPLYTIIIRRVFRSGTRSALPLHVLCFFILAFAVEEDNYWFCNPPPICAKPLKHKDLPPSSTKQ